jgi:hypothetical protein
MNEAQTAVIEKTRDPCILPAKPRIAKKSAPRKQLISCTDVDPSPMPVVLGFP